jgi:translocation and assembly module TamA
VLPSGNFSARSRRSKLLLFGLACATSPALAMQAPDGTADPTAAHAAPVADSAAVPDAVPDVIPDPGPDSTPLPIGAPPESSFSPLPGDVAWPTVETTTESDATGASDVHYTVAFKGLSSLGLDSDFKGLSALWSKKGEVSNLAQINRRVTEDKDLIDQLLRSVGHYGGTTQVAVTAPNTAGAPIQVAISVDPGPAYEIAAISVLRPDNAKGGDPAPVVLPLLGVKPGDRLNAANLNTAEDALAARLADAGYPFPVINPPEINIDHATRSAAIVQRIDLGPRGIHGALRMTGAKQGFTDAHLAVLARFKPGDPYRGADVEDLRRALIQTSLFGGVTIKPVAGGQPDADGNQRVDMVVTTEVAPVHTISATGGYSTGQGIRVEASWSHRNLIQPEGGFTVRGVGAEREQLLSVGVARRNWRKRDQTLKYNFILSAEQQDAYNASTAELAASIDRESNIIWQKPWTYSIGVQALITRQRDFSAPTDPKNIYYILAFPGTLTWDQSNNLLNPSSGFRLTGRVSPEFTLRSGVYFGYVKSQVEASAYLPLGKFVLAGRVHLGAIAGASRGRIAPDRRFYAGGGGSVRGFNYQGVGPKDINGVPTGGNSLTEVAGEARYAFHAFGSDLGLVGFVDAGQVYQSALPGFSSLKVGAGIGFRYFTSFGPVRIDVATPVTRSPGDPRVAFYVSIGQAF